MTVPLASGWVISAQAPASTRPADGAIPIISSAQPVANAQPAAAGVNPTPVAQPLVQAAGSGRKLFHS